jgi:hypothetical protein
MKCALLHAVPTCRFALQGNELACLVMLYRLDTSPQRRPELAMHHRLPASSKACFSLAFLCPPGAYSTMFDQNSKTGSNASLK